MSKFSIEHKLISSSGRTVGKLGIILIRNPKNSEDSGDDVFQFNLFSSITESWFLIELTREDLCSQCPILRESDELIATLEVPPTIEYKCAVMVVTFLVAGRKRTYPINITLEGRRIITDAEKIEDLKKENSSLRKQVAALEQRMSNVDAQYEELASNISVIAHHLLTLHSKDGIYNSHLEKYPAMICDVDALRTFNELAHVEILYGGGHEKIFKAMVDSKLTRPLIDMIFSLNMMRVTPSRDPIIISNIEYLVKDLSASQLVASTGQSVLEYIDSCIQSAKNDVDISGWKKIRDCISARMAVI